MRPSSLSRSSRVSLPQAVPDSAPLSQGQTTPDPGANGPEQAHREEPIVAARAPDPESHGPSATGLRWDRWRVLLREEHDGDWVRAVCCRCHPRPDAAAQATALANRESGRFVCLQCGQHGDAKLSPSDYRAVRADLSQPWWHEVADASPWLAKAFAQGVTWPGRWPLGVSETVVPEGDGVQWRPCLVLPCRWKPDADPTSLMFLPLAEEGDSADGFLEPTNLPGAESAPWGWDEVDGDTVIFVSHPLDRLALAEAGVKNVVCLPPDINPLLPNHGNWSLMTVLEKPLAVIKRVVMAIRADEVGVALENELARRVGKERCFRVRWQDYRTENVTASPWSVLVKHGADVLAEAIEKAPCFPVAGVYELYDVEESFELLYEFGLQRGQSTGYPSLDLNFTVKPGQWTVVTGIPGHGKSTLVDALMVNLALLHGWRFGVFSPESQPIERHFAALMEKAAGAPFTVPHDAKGARISKEDKDRLKPWLNEHFKALLPDEDNEQQWTVDGMLGLARTLVLRHGIRGLLIDPWNELTHNRPPHMTQAEYLAVELTKIRRFARINGVHVFVVAHPNKQELKADGKYAVVTPYMLDGGANWRNKADNFLSVFRHVNQIDGDILDIYTQKIRFKEVGCLGRASLRYDPTTCRYVDDIDASKRDNALRSPLPVASQQQRTQERKIRDLKGMPIRTDPVALPASPLYL